MNSLIRSIGLLFLAGGIARAADAPSASVTNASAFTSAWRTALSENKPLLLYFTASWCGPCRLMAGTTFTNDTVQRELQRFVWLKVDIDAEPKLAQERGINSVPTFLFLYPDGEELNRTSGYLDADRFLALLANGRARFAAAAERKRKFAVQQQEITAALTSGNTARQAQAIETLYALCTAHEPSEQQFAANRIKELARQSPARLLNGLLHTNLATRIQVANALRSRFGEAFAYDPWEKAEARAQAVARLKTQLQAEVEAAR